MKVMTPLISTLITFLLILSVCPAQSQAKGSRALSKGQTLYVPAYSNIVYGNKERSIPLTITLSLRNTDPTLEITITRLEYYDTKGKLIISLLKEALLLQKLESSHLTIPQDDTTGGIGANFIVAWKSAQPVNVPIVEAIMIGTKSAQGISFTSRGQEIFE